MGEREEEEMALCVTHSSRIIFQSETRPACVELLSMIYFYFLLVLVYKWSSRHVKGEVGVINRVSGKE